ncbi:MAG: GNAT family N-acetyltransferase [Xenococcaceae cyanobacterium MO_188.B32]|nr:GNAT family N-acetyltransferase [Xenococcaceae cyanobacterium MO_188.B32]
MTDNCLPSGCVLRRATVEDIWSIRKLVFAAKLDFTQLRWQQFWLIEQEEKIIACGQLRNFTDAQELGSLVVESSWRGQGIGGYLTLHLIQQASKPLYLECIGQKLANFYSRYGFEIVTWQELPRSLKFKFGISQLAKTLIRLPVFFMHCDRASIISRH